MTCFTNIYQRNWANGEYEQFVIEIYQTHQTRAISIRCIQKHVCDKNENARVCAKWQWNALDCCYWIVQPVSSVVQSSNIVPCFSLPFRTNPCVLAIDSSVEDVAIHVTISSFPFLIHISDLVLYGTPAKINQLSIGSHREDTSSLADPVHDHFLWLGAFILLDLLFCGLAWRQSTTRMQNQPRYFRDLVSIIAVTDITIATGIVVCVVTLFLLPATCTYTHTKDTFPLTLRWFSDIVWMVLGVTIRKLAVPVPSNSMLHHPTHWQLLGALNVILIPITLLTLIYPPANPYSSCGHSQTITAGIAFALLIAKVNPLWVLYIGYRISRHYNEACDIIYPYGGGVDEELVLQCEGETRIADFAINHTDIRSNTVTERALAICCDRLKQKETNGSSKCHGGEIYKTVRGPNGIPDRHEVPIPGSSCSAFLDSPPFSHSILVASTVLVSSVCFVFLCTYMGTIAYDVQAIVSSSTFASAAWLVALLCLPMLKHGLVNGGQQVKWFSIDVI